MANIIRCVLPDGVHRFKPFTVSDYRDLLLVRNDLSSKTDEEQREIFNEILEEYFPDHPESWRPYIFLKVFTGSIGKDKIPVVFTCPKCGKSHKVPFKLDQEPLVNPYIDTAGIRINFDFPKVNGLTVDMIKDNIRSIVDCDDEFLWNELSDEEKLQVIDAIDIESFNELLTKLAPIKCKLRMKCCDDHTRDYTDILDVFNIILNPDEIFVFYQINHVLSKSNYDYDSIMHMIPVERNIALSLVEKDNKK